MNRDQELQLIQRCLEYSEHKTTTLRDSESHADTWRYRDAQCYEQEMQKIHKVLPFPLVHSSEIAKNNCVLSASSPLGNLIVSRDAAGKVHVFHNMCRHRGVALVSGEAKQSKRITCPYHAWSYTTDGKLASVPGQSHCFPNLDKSKNRLLEIPSIEKYGFIWVCPNGGKNVEARFEQSFHTMATAFEWMGTEKLAFFKRKKKVWQANWKLLVEGGIETYHFSYAHKNTIGPSFMNNTAEIDVFGDHLRVVMPTKQLKEIAALPEQEQDLRRCSHVLYMIFPSTVLLVQHQHIEWIYIKPVSVDQTEISITSLVPMDQLEARAEHWQRNHEITNKVLDEDFELGEGIQASMSTGAMEKINYGRNEWALTHVNHLFDRLIR